MAEPAVGLDGVTVATDFANPSLTPEEQVLQGLSEEDLLKQINNLPPPIAPVTQPAKIETPEPIQAPPQAIPEPQEPPKTAEQPDLTIPKKFQKPDGTLDEVKLDKSVEAIKAKLSDYLNAEKEMSKLRQQPRQPIEPGASPVVAQDTFLQKFKEDFANQPEETILRLANAIEQGTKMSVMGEIEELKRLLSLKDLAESNPDMLTQATLNELKQIRTDRPHLTWEDALEIHRGRMAMKNKGTIGATPSKPQAPILPGGISPSIQPASSSAVTLDKVGSLLQGKTSQEQEAILAKILPHK